MRNLIFLGVLLGGVASAMAQTPAQFSENAKKAALELRQVIAETKESPPGKFYKVTYNLDSAKWDVKKTDSMLHPVQAVVSAEIVGAASNAAATKEEANIAEVQPAGATKIELTYVPTASGWKYLEGRLYADVMRKWLPVEYEKCPDKKAFTCTVIDAFSVKR